STRRADPCSRDEPMVPLTRHRFARPPSPQRREGSSGGGEHADDSPPTAEMLEECTASTRNLPLPIKEKDGAPLHAGVRGDGGFRSRLRARRVEPEWLDRLPPGDARAVRSRRDLDRINRWMLQPGIMARALA